MVETDLSNVITFNPQVIARTTTLDELLLQWASADFHHWPVTDDQMRLLGIVSEQDIARAIFEVAAQFPESLRLGLEQLRAVRVDELMSTEVISISRWDTQNNGLYLLLKHGIHSLPVLDDERLVGMVTTTDYLREFSYGDLAISRHTVSEFVQDDNDPIDCDASLDETMAAMDARALDQIGVVHGALPLGILTRRDIRLAQCRVVSRRTLRDEYSLPGPTTLRALVAKSPTVPPGARISEAAGLMVEHHRQAISVVTQAGRMVGVVTESAVLRAMAGQKSHAMLARA